MCGILGLISTQPLNKYEKNIRQLFIESEKRGTDAMGLFVCNLDGSPILEHEGKKYPHQLFKDETFPTKFYQAQKGQLNLDQVTVLLGHTRAGTGSTPSDNKNNHPFASKDFVWAHNGMINKHTELRKEFKLDYDSDCDSAVIGHLVQQFYDQSKDPRDAVIKAASVLAEKNAGGFAVWVIHKESRRIFFFRNTNPFEYITLNDGTFVFASTGYFMSDAFKHSKEYNNKVSTTLKADHVHELLPDGKSFKVEVVAELPKAGSSMYQKKSQITLGGQGYSGPQQSRSHVPTLPTSKKSLPKAIAERAVALSDALGLDGWFCRRKNDCWLFITGQEKFVKFMSESAKYKDRVADVEHKAESGKVVMLELRENEVEGFLDDVEKFFRPQPAVETGESLVRYFENLPGISFARDNGMKIFFVIENYETAKFLATIGITLGKENEFSVKKGKGGKSHHNTLAKIQQKIREMKTHFPEVKNEPMESI